MLNSDDLLRIAYCAFALYPHFVDDEGAVADKITEVGDWDFVFRAPHTDVLERKVLANDDGRPKYGVTTVIIEHGKVFVESTLRPGHVAEYAVKDLFVVDDLTPFDPERPQDEIP